MTNPTNGEVIAHVPDMDGGDVRRAIEAAHTVNKLIHYGDVSVN